MFSYNAQRCDKNMQIKCHFSLSLFPFPIPSPLKVPTINRFLWWRIFSMECFPPRLGTAFKTTDFNLLKEFEPERRLQFGCTCEMWQWPQNRSLVWMANHPTSSPTDTYQRNKKSKSLLTSRNGLSRGKVFGVRLNGSCSCWLPEAQRKDHCLPGCLSIAPFHTHLCQLHKTKQNNSSLEMTRDPLRHRMLHICTHWSEKYVFYTYWIK